MNLEEFIRRTGPSRCKRSADGGYLVSCPCPDHGKGQGDRHQSLSINAGDAGGVVLHCHVGCKTESVVAAFGLTMADLMDGNRRPETPSSTRQSRKLAATYKYVDEGGKLLFQVIRYEPKDFRQRRPDGDGDWVWRLGDTRRVLYRLPEVIAAVAVGTPVIICEGEKDVEALREAGAVATCNPHGAGKWKPEYSEVLRGADVTIVQDKDEPGRQHAAAVMASLAPVAASVRVVEAAAGKDAADHLAAGKTLEEFVNVDEGELGVRAAKEKAVVRPHGAATAARRLKLVPMAEVVPVSVQWLWETRIPRGKLSVVAGDPGLGKSYLTLKIAATISTGGVWPDGSRATPANVLIISAEDDAADTIRPRLDRLGADVSRISMIDGVLSGDAEFTCPFSLRMDLDLLRAAVVDTAATIVIVDPLNAFLGGIDSHKAAEVRGVLSPLAHVAATTQAAVLAVHHLNKGTSANALYRASGSLDFVAAARIVHGVAADPAVEGRRVFVPVKCNIAAMPEGLGFRIGDEGVSFDDLPVTVDAAAAFSTRSVDHEERSERDMAKDFISTELADGPVPAATVLTAARGYGFSKMTVRRAASDLHVRKTKQGYQGAWLWSLPEDLEAAEVSQGGRPQNMSTFAAFDDSGLDREAGMSTFGATEVVGDEQCPSDPAHPGDNQGAKGAHGQGLSSLEESKDAQGRRRRSIDDAGDSQLAGDNDDRASVRALEPVVGDGDNHPDDRDIAPVSVELFRRAVEAAVSNGAVSLPLIAKKCGCGPDVAERIRVDLETVGVIPATGGSTYWSVLIDEGQVESVVAAYAARCGADLVLAPDAPAAAVHDDNELLL